MRINVLAPYNNIGADELRTYDRQAIQRFNKSDAPHRTSFIFIARDFYEVSLKFVNKTRLAHF